MTDFGTPAPQLTVRRVVAPSYTGGVDTTPLEERFACELRAFLADKSMGDSASVDGASELASLLEYLLPILLQTKFPEWRGESIDQVVCHYKIYTPRIAGFAGACRLISDQSITTFFAEFEISPSLDSLASYRLRLGEESNGKLGLRRDRFTMTQGYKLIASLREGIDRCLWKYEVSG